ncbi:hypothetical protein BAUCODRAFT_319349 [Baudoinia panamericana UAMH 10762]|uniref:Uncharacterized protein n=1 Tax=Baudoinia panamericana (strain UAMH 10762) TaxID=717646 RepID=M2MIZ1_BAUPA|nr:uncharacterized protein BAUCODRAFT_319349 [Baudoinia panamericana UAMH 10762]EMC91243.1 hypothetical protein BAUCODRAFT_319349 [Baudoinia panamericana UAMH 10762]
MHPCMEKSLDTTRARWRAATCLRISFIGSFFAGAISPTLPWCRSALLELPHCSDGSDVKKMGRARRELVKTAAFAECWIIQSTPRYGVRSVIAAWLIIWTVLKTGASES